MDTDEAATKLLAEFEQDALLLTADMEADDRIRPMMLRVMNELTQIVGSAGTRLCVGTIAHVFRPAGDDPFGGEAPPLPYQYDFVVITDRFLIVAGGFFDTETGQVLPDATTVRALNKIVSVTQGVQPGGTRGDGSISTHYDIHVAFADGSTESIPGVEDELSATGRKRVAELIPALYASMAS